MSAGGSSATRIRRAAPEDIEALTVLADQLGYSSSPAEVEARLNFMAAHPALHAVSVAESGSDGVVGWVHVYLSTHLESEPFAEIGGLVVDERHRGRGLGEALVQEAERWARARGVAHLRVRANVVRERAHRFYARRGFERLKQQVVFQKRLG